MEFVQPYGAGIICLMIFVIITLMHGGYVGYQKADAKIKAGSEPDLDYGTVVYRSHRAHQNAAENMGAITAALVFAVLAGASAFWVNWLMLAFLILRVVYLVIYMTGTGKEAQGPRTFAYVASWAINIAIAVMAMLAVL